MTCLTLHYAAANVPTNEVLFVVLLVFEHWAGLASYLSIA